MPRYSPIYSELKLRLCEVQNLTTLANATSKGMITHGNAAMVDALCRGAIVLLSSHLEGYVKGLAARGIETIEQNQVSKARLGDLFRYHLSRDLILEIQQSSRPESVTSRIDAFLQRDILIWNGSDVFVGPLSSNTFVRGVSAPNHGSIKTLFGRFGYSTFEADLSHTLKGDFSVCRGMVDHVVDQRNKIAHGDHIVSGAPRDLLDMLTWLTLYCRATDKIVCDWFKNIGCVLR